MSATGITNLFFAGVGGQGLVLANSVTATAAQAAGLDVKTSDIYGLAMRGGAVYGFHRHGPQVLTSTFAAGEGHVLVALEPLEGMRWAKMMRKGGHVVLNTRPVFPSPVLLEKEAYPTDIAHQLRQAGLEVTCLDALALARIAGGERMMNSVLLGVASRHLPSITASAWAQAFQTQFVGTKFEPNWKAFELGREAAS